MIKDIINNLPGYNCGKCGSTRCEDFARHLINGNKELKECSVLAHDKFEKNKININNILANLADIDNEIIIGLIDSYQADIILEPLADEHSCTEVLLPMSNNKLHINDIIRYRPLGCPIIHFAKIIEINNMLLSVHIIGPGDRQNDSNEKFIDIGSCMIIAFNGKYKGKQIKVGETVRFLPSHCMMQKIHSGVVVNIENNNVTIEGIDLKVWDIPKQF